MCVIPKELGSLKNPSSDDHLLSILSQLQAWLGSSQVLVWAHGQDPLKKGKFCVKC